MLDGAMCLVTGATGFLGSHLCRRLKNAGHTVLISNTKCANLMDLKNLEVYKDFRFDYIFHLAAITKAGDYCLKHKGDQWLSNQAINTNILTYWKEEQPQAKMICMGTSCSYSPGTIMEEKNYLLGQPDGDLYTYAMTKRMLLVGLQSLEEQYGLEWLYFIPSTLYGPGFELEDNHFIFDFIRNCYEAKYRGKDFVYWGDGSQKRELIYVRDAITAILGLLDFKNQVFNLGAGEDHTIKDFVQKICKIYDYDFDLVGKDLTKYAGVKEKKLMIDKTVKCLGHGYNRTSLDIGLKESVGYFMERMGT